MYLDFDLMGTDNQYWASQLQNDLENFYTNEGLKIIGSFSHPYDLTKFQLVMYQVEIFERSKKFDLEVEAVYSGLTANKLQELLNEKYFNEHKILRNALNVYEQSGDKTVMNIKINTQLLVFQDLSKNMPKIWIDENVMFIVVNMPKLDRNKNPAESIQLFVKDIKKKRDLYLLTIIPNTRMSNSLLVFMRMDTGKEPDVIKPEF